jgi:carbon monoxide dehydrogenase subunit G
MPITLHETFRVAAPIEDDDRTFLGTIRVKVGAITTSYKGKINFEDVDEAARSVRMRAEGRETGGGTAKGTMSSTLMSISRNETELTVEASVDVTGRIAQVSRGMIEGVSKQLFAQFVACAKASLETPEHAAAAIEEANRPVSVLPLVLGTIWSSITSFVRRVFRRSPDGA